MANRIRNVDFHCRSNNTAHRTIEITGKQLIVRRGQSFLLSLGMMRPSDGIFTLIVETGSAPSERRGTRCEFGNPSPMYSSDMKAIWRYKTERSANPQTLTLSVTPPADAPVGRYSLFAEIGRQKTKLGTLVVLFNPWCSDDWVFLPDERERQEYVMNEQGIVYRGTSHYISGCAWNFGQFEEEMVDICLRMLDINPKHQRDPADDVSARCNPIYVSRVLSAMINSAGDRGVLEGRWDNNYADGVPPTHWIGSVNILQRWYKNSCHPVKYGQCWVFAAVMCTVMRFLGIPCRVVTNFESAHDTHNNLTIDQSYDNHGSHNTAEKDSIWNFHVWVEGWMKRPDLKKDGSYDGWQVLDPTPQERSEGVFCCGPAPVAAILRGDTNMKYDVPFVFAEVNADIVKWMVGADGRRTKMHHLTDTTRVGQNISTKAVGLNSRNDLTNSYKYREGSATERAVFKRAVRLNSKENEEDDEGEEPPKLEMTFEEDPKMMNSQDINLKLKLRSKDRTSRTFFIRINTQAMMYTGKVVRNLQSVVHEKMLLPGQEVVLSIQIPFSVYGNYMLGCNSMKVSALATDKQDEDDVYMTETDIALEDPPLSIKVLNEARLGQMLKMEVEFTNPLNETLRNCSLTVEGSGLFRPGYVQSNLRELKPKEKLTLEILTTPYKTGLKTVVADFDCSAFRDVKGSCIIEVKP